MKKDNIFVLNDKVKELIKKGWNNGCQNYIGRKVILLSKPRTMDIKISANGKIGSVAVVYFHLINGRNEQHVNGCWDYAPIECLTPVLKEKIDKLMSL